MRAISRHASRMSWTVFLLATALPLLAGCSENKQASIEAAQRLAENLYPGKLEVYDTRWRLKHDGGHDVVFAIKGDPVTRIVFAVDKDPAICTAGSPCEAKLREAHDYGVGRAEDLRAIERSFRSCGAPVLSVDQLTLQKPYRSEQSVAARVTLRTAIDTAARQATEARLTGCVEAWGRERAGKPWSDRAGYMTVSIIPAESSPEIAPPKTLTFETRAPLGEGQEAAFALSIKLENGAATAQPLRFSPRFKAFRELEHRIAAEATTFLKSSAAMPEAHVEPMVFRTTLDPVRTDVIRGYLMACTRKPDAKPCRADIAVRFRHDFTSGETSELEVLRDIRDARNIVVLPALPGDPSEAQQAGDQP